MDLMKQMSSAIFAVCGSSSLSQLPHSPCCANLKDRRRGRELSLKRGHAGEPLAHADRIRQIRAAQRLQLRLVVEQIELRGRAVLEQIDDALGFRREMRQAGQSVGRLASSASSDASAAMPMPVLRQAEEMPARDRACLFDGSSHCLVTTSSRFRIRLAD